MRTITIRLSAVLVLALTAAACSTESSGPGGGDDTGDTIAAGDSAVVGGDVYEVGPGGDAYVADGAADPGADGVSDAAAPDPETTAGDPDGATGADAATGEPDEGPDVADDPDPDAAVEPTELAPGACCSPWDTSSPCPAGHICSDGTCLPTPAAGGCWDSAACDCGWAECDVVPSSYCVGAIHCPCGVDCAQVMAEGTCQPYPPADDPVGACCATDLDCGEPYVCVDPWVVNSSANALVPVAPGVCVMSAPEGSCWQDGDCSPGWICEGAQVPECWDGEAPPPVMGTCHEPSGLYEGACCTAGADPCNPGLACYEGQCLPELAAGGCWSDGDCDCGWTVCDSEPQSYCVGASMCSCGDECDLWTQAGTCAPYPPSDQPTCCIQDVDCAVPGDICVFPDLATTGGAFSPFFKIAFMGTCAPAPTAATECYAAADCGPGEACVGAVTPVCWELDQTGPAAFGTCGEPLPGGCCLTDADCPSSFICVDPGGGGASDLRVCVQPAPPGMCWSDSDCAGADETCHGMADCGCQVDCDADYLGPGVCVVPAEPCTAVQPQLVTEICDAASTVVFDGEACVATCPGCCGCQGFCDLTFPDLASCQAACE